MIAFDKEMELENNFGILRVVGNIGRNFELIGKFEDSVAFLKQLLGKLEPDVYTSAKAGIYTRIGSISMINLSDYHGAIEYFGKAATLYHECGNKVGESEAIDNIGGTYWYLGEAGLSVEHARRAVAIAEEAGNPLNLINRLTNAAYSYMHLEDYQKVRELSERAKALSIEFQNTQGIAWADMGLAMALLRLGDTAGALEHAGNAIDILEKFGDKHGLGYGYFRRGEALVALGLFNEAFEAFNKSLENRILIQSELEIAETQCELGKLLLQFGRYDEAVSMLHQTLEIAEKTSGKAVLYATHKALSDVYNSLEEYQKAFYHLQKHMAIRDEVHSKESSVKAARMEYMHKQELQQKEQEATDKILNNVLPLSITKRLKAGQNLIADLLPEVTVLFADVVGFTPLAARLSAEDLVKLLAYVFKHFDTICLKHGLEKIKTIGDAYMAVAGAPDYCDDHALRCAKAALEMLEDFTIPPDVLHEDLKNLELDFRIGIHTGSAVAGVIGESKFAYDLWGDAVNTASRMESHGEEGKIHVSEEFKHAVETQNFASLQFIERGEIDIKGKGMMKTYFLEKA